MSYTFVQNIPKWAEACGIFARNTFVALMGISLVLSYRSISFNVRSKKVRRYIQKKLRRFWYLIISAITIQLASGILMGEDLVIRFGIIHFAACVAFLGSIVGGILIHFGRSLHPWIRIIVLTAVALLTLFGMTTSVLQKRTVVLDRARAHLSSLALGDSIGLKDIHSLDLFTIPRWAPLVILAATCTIIFLELYDAYRPQPLSVDDTKNVVQNKTIFGNLSKIITTISKHGLSIYVIHMVLFMFIFSRWKR